MTRLLFDVAEKNQYPKHGSFPVIEKIDPIGVLSLSVEVGEDDAFGLKTNDGSECDVIDTLAAVCVYAYALKEIGLVVNNEINNSTTYSIKVDGKTL